MTRIKTVRERTSVPSRLAGIVAVVVPPLGLVAAVWLRPVDLVLLAVFYVACGRRRATSSEVAHLAEARETMPKGQKCPMPMCGKYTLQQYTKNQLRCTNCGTVVKKDAM